MEISREKEIKDKIRNYLRDESRNILSHEVLEEGFLRSLIGNIIAEIKEDEQIEVSQSDSQKIIDDLIDELLGLGPLRSLLEDEAITEIMVNGPQRVYIEKDGKIILTDIKFEDNQQLLNIIQRILSSTRRRIDEMVPFTEVCLPDGSRVNIIIPPLALNGPVITIRKFLTEFSKIEHLIRVGTLNNNMAAFLVASIKAKLNIIFSGATGVGKTTTLNVLSSYIPAADRIITIEDTAELRLNQEHVVRLETKPPNIEGKGEITIRDLFRNSLRMRPNRIILGEIRSLEALDMLQAMCSGHNGSLAVLHANSARDVISRIETMILSSLTSIPLLAIRKQIASGLNLIVQQEQLLDGSRKITHISEVRGIDNDDVVLTDLFSYESQGIDKYGKVQGFWKGQGIVPLFFDRFSKMGVELNQEMFNS